MTQTELEIFRLKFRLHLIERMFFSVCLLLPKFSSGPDFEVNLRALRSLLERDAKTAEAAFLEGHPNDGPLFADEAREIVEEQKKLIESLYRVVHP